MPKVPEMVESERQFAPIAKHPLVSEIPWAKVDVAVPVALMVPVWRLSVWMPPWKVDVAVVEALREPTVTCELVASIDVPLNHRSAFERRVALVPPEPMESWVPKVSPPLITAPPVIVEDAWERKPPANNEEAEVEVASMVPVYSRNDWMPPTKVLVAVVDATRFPTVNCVPVAAIDAPSYQMFPVRKTVLLVPPFAIESVPEVTSPVEFAERAPESPTILSPCERIWMPVKDEVAEVPPNLVAIMPWEKVEEAVVPVALI
jgi:hypothetical protein